MVKIILNPVRILTINTLPWISKAYIGRQGAPIPEQEWNNLLDNYHGFFYSFYIRRDLPLIGQLLCSLFFYRWI